MLAQFAQQQKHNFLQITMSVCRQLQMIATSTQNA